MRARQDSDGLVAHPGTRRTVNLASGVRWERLTPHSDPEVEFLHVVYPVGAESCADDALVTHRGREYGYVSSGTLGVRVGFDEYELGPGTSIAFDSSSPHRLWTIGGEPVHAIWVVIGRAADPRANAADLADLASPQAPRRARWGVASLGIAQSARATGRAGARAGSALRSSCPRTRSAAGRAGGRC